MIQYFFVCQVYNIKQCLQVFMRVWQKVYKCQTGWCLAVQTFDSFFQILCVSRTLHMIVSVMFLSNVLNDEHSVTVLWVMIYSHIYATTNVICSASSWFSVQEQSANRIFMNESMWELCYLPCCQIRCWNRGRGMTVSNYSHWHELDAFCSQGKSVNQSIASDCVTCTFMSKWYYLGVK